MVLREKGEMFSIEEITIEELTAIYNAIISSNLNVRRFLYGLKTQIENHNE